MTFRLRVQVWREDRESFFSWLWSRFGTAGLLGIHEGTVLSDQAAEQGFETESFTVDAALAPRERDWIASQERGEAELYFASLDQAQVALTELRAIEGIQTGSLEEQKDE